MKLKYIRLNKNGVVLLNKVKIIMLNNNLENFKVTDEDVILLVLKNYLEVSKGSKHGSK
jgi:uncharacterized ubiquitin-like protein YukD